MRESTTPFRSPANLSSSQNLLCNSKLILHFPVSFKPKHIPFFKVICSQTSDSHSTQTPNLISSLRSIPDWADAIKERGMQKKKSLYNHEKWIQHRSSLRHVRHLLSSLSSRVILSLIPPVFFFTSVAVVVATYNSAVSLHWLPEFFPLLRASSLPYQLTASALALLLVFRTEASYARFEEGRKAWMKVISGADEFARQVMANVDTSSNLVLKKALLQYIMAFPVALKCHVIYGSDIRKDLKDLLKEDDLAVLLTSKHHPRCIIEFISQSIRLLLLDDSKRIALESKISCFHEGIGICEQLMGIPIPLSYTRLTSRFLVLWHLTLPVILWDDCNWIVVPATFISAASLFCIEEVGVLIEEPFPMLAIDEQCNLVHDSIQEAIAIEHLIQSQLLAKKKCQSNGHLTNGRLTS